MNDETIRTVQIEGRTLFYTITHSEYDGGYYCEIFDASGCEVSNSDVFNTRQKALNDAREKAKVLIP